MAIRSRRHRAVSDLSDMTVMDDDGAVVSVQSATVVLSSSQLASLWSATNLERLARTYWRYLTRITLGLIRVVYTAQGREVVLIARPLKLLSFHIPDYELDENQGRVTWRIANGLLVARPDEGLLAINVRRLPEGPERNGSGSATQAPAAVRVDVEVRNFYPSIAAKISDHLYRWTQSKIHVIVTYAFLKSLARNDLAESVAGRFSEPKG